MDYGSEYNIKEMEAALGLKASRTREIMNELIGKGLVRGTSSTRNRKYLKVKKDFSSSSNQ